MFVRKALHVCKDIFLMRMMDDVVVLLSGVAS